MTSRPISDELRRMLLNTAVALILLVAAMLLAAGCTSQTPAINQTYPATATFTNIPAVTTAPVTTIPSICPAPADGSYWIMINPISNVTAGGRVLVNGSTNIPAGGLLNVTLFHPARQKTTVPRMKGTVSIVKNGNCTNMFALIFDGSNYSNFTSFISMEVEVYSTDETLPGYNYPGNLTKFLITP